MPKLLLSPDVDRDFNSILFWSHENFGEQARQRYQALLVQAIRDVAEDPAWSVVLKSHQL